MKHRRYPRFSRPDLKVESPLIDCRLLNLSTSGLAVETSAALRLRVPYPFRLRDGQQTLGIEAEICWCRLVRIETVDGESKPVFHAGAAFVEWLPEKLEPRVSAFEQQVDDTLDQWMEQSRTARRGRAERTVIHQPRRQPPL